MAIDTSSGYYTAQAVNPRVMSEPDKKEPPNLIKKLIGHLGTQGRFGKYYGGVESSLYGDRGLEILQSADDETRAALKKKWTTGGPKYGYGEDVWEQLVSGEYETGGGLLGSIKNAYGDDQAIKLAQGIGKEGVKAGTADAITGTETMAEMAGGGGLWTLLLLATMQGLMNPGSGVAKFNEKYLKPNLRLPS